MKKALMLTVALVALSACDKVPVGNVGIKVNNLGTDKGIEQEILGVGWYWVGFSKTIYTFPTFMQNHVWTRSHTEGSPEDESFSFQTIEGLSVNADIGISYQIEPEKVPNLFQTYRRGLDEIRSVYLRNIIRDALVKSASKKPIESVYGAGKADLLDEVKKEVSAKVGGLGIIVHELSWVGDLRLPETVVASINAKIEATQKAQQRENEVQTAKAEAAKAVAQAQGEADSRMINAKAEAAANRIIAESITPELVRYQSVIKWDGALPTYNGGGAVPFIEVK